MYKAAVKYAPDAECRHLYENEAARIAEIQKEILTISQNEKPYDVFICYKEADENGQRTRDSQWAQEVYYGLTELGYKVFFSRITLEDKLGQEYEPYIFAALQSARVMVIIGSKPEYFNAVWVKNEWSRYLALMAHDHKRLLIPCYRDMDPYDLPDELSSLQSQDMSRIGFMQDLVRGIRKVLDSEKKTEHPKIVQQFVQTGPSAAVPGINSLMDRAYLFMEDGEFDSAKEYLNRVLDIDPKYAPAYAAQVCVTFHIRKEAGLADATFQFEKNADWLKALRFANPQQKSIYEGYAEKVQKRVSVQIRNYAYDCAVEMAVVPGAIRDELDSELATYKISCTQTDRNRADGKRRPNSQSNISVFNQAFRSKEPGDVSEHNLMIAANMFEAVNDEESAEAASKCRKLAEWARQKKKRKKIIRIIGFLTAAILISIIFLITQSIIPENKYREAISLQQSGKYEDAIEAFTVLGNYSNATTQITETRYLMAKNLASKGDYIGAAAIFIGIKGYKDVDSFLANDQILAALTAMYSVGNYVTFGNYPQSRGGNDNTPIEWLVLTQDGNKVLLISRYGLDVLPYNNKDTSITWEECTLRTWLNDTFLHKAFSTQEQTRIVLTNTNNDITQGYNWNGNPRSGGNNTQDRIFLLSYVEANKYLGVIHGDSKNTKSRVSPTAYAEMKGALTFSLSKTTDGTASGKWWLRSPGYFKKTTALVIGDGSLSYDDVNYSNCCVRPALWINLESGIF